MMFFWALDTWCMKEKTPRNFSGLRKFDPAWMKIPPSSISFQNIRARPNRESEHGLDFHRLLKAGSVGGLVRVLPRRRGDWIAQGKWFSFKRTLPHSIGLYRQEMHKFIHKLGIEKRVILWRTSCRLVATHVPFSPGRKYMIKRMRKQEGGKSYA